MREHLISRDDAENDLLSAAAFLAESIKSADGHAEAIKAVVPLFLEKGNVDLAAELANQIDEPFSRDRMLIRVAERCAHDNDDEYGLQLADAVEDDGMRGQAFEKIALMKVANGQLDRAADLAGGMAHPDRVLGGIAVKQAEAGDTEAARATLESIDFPAAKVEALMMTATGLAAKGDNERAVASIEHAVEAAAGIEHQEERIRSLCDAANLFVEVKRSDLAVQTFDDARTLAEGLDNVHRDVFLGLCALGFKVAGSEDLAEGTLDLLRDKTEMASALLTFAREDWRAGRREDAIEGLDEAFEILRGQRDIETRDSRARNALLTNIAVQLAGFGEMDKAIEAAQANQDPQEEMSGLTQIAQVQAVQGKHDAVSETLNMIGDDSARLFALISVSDSYEAGGDRERAAELLNEAANFSDSVPQLASRSSALNELVGRFAKYGHEGKAREIAAENLDVIAEIRDESSLAVSLAGLAATYTDAGLTVGEGELEKVRPMIYKAG